jgi:hypothetical protein
MVLIVSPLFSPKNPEISMVQGRAWRWIVLLLREQQADRARGRDPLRHHQAALWPWSWVNHGKVRNEKFMVYHGLSWFIYPTKTITRNFGQN